MTIQGWERKLPLDYMETSIYAKARGPAARLPYINFITTQPDLLYSSFLTHTNSPQQPRNQHDCAPLITHVQIVRDDFVAIVHLPLHIPRIVSRTHGQWEANTDFRRPPTNLISMRTLWWKSISTYQSHARLSCHSRPFWIESMHYTRSKSLTATLQTATAKGKFKQAYPACV